MLPANFCLSKNKHIAIKKASNSMALGIIDACLRKHADKDRQVNIGKTKYVVCSECQGRLPSIYGGTYNGTGN